MWHVYPGNLPRIPVRAIGEMPMMSIGPSDLILDGGKETTSDGVVSLLFKSAIRGFLDPGKAGKLVAKYLGRFNIREIELRNIKTLADSVTSVDISGQEPAPRWQLPFRQQQQRITAFMAAAGNLEDLLKDKENLQLPGWGDVH